MAVDRYFRHPLHCELFKDGIINEVDVVIAEKCKLEEYRAALEDRAREATAVEYNDRKTILDEVQDLLLNELRSPKLEAKMFSLLHQLGLSLDENGLVTLETHCPNKKPFQRHLGIKEPYFNVQERRLIEEEKRIRVQKRDLRTLDEWLAKIEKATVRVQKPVHLPTPKLRNPRKLKNPDLMSEEKRWSDQNKMAKERDKMHIISDKTKYRSDFPAAKIFSKVKEDGEASAEIIETVRNETSTELHVRRKDGQPLKLDGEQKSALSSRTGEKCLVEDKSKEPFDSDIECADKHNRIVNEETIIIMSVEDNNLPVKSDISTKHGTLNISKSMEKVTNDEMVSRTESKESLKQSMDDISSDSVTETAVRKAPNELYMGRKNEMALQDTETETNIRADDVSTSNLSLTYIDQTPLTTNVGSAGESNRMIEDKMPSNLSLTCMDQTPLSPRVGSVRKSDRKEDGKMPSKLSLICMDQTALSSGVGSVSESNSKKNDKMQSKLCLEDVEKINLRSNAGAEGETQEPVGKKSLELRTENTDINIIKSESGAKEDLSNVSADERFPKHLKKDTDRTLLKLGTESKDTVKRKKDELSQKWYADDSKTAIQYDTGENEFIEKANDKIYPKLSLEDKVALNYDVKDELNAVTAGQPITGDKVPIKLKVQATDVLETRKKGKFRKPMAEDERKLVSKSGLEAEDTTVDDGRMVSETRDAGQVLNEDKTDLHIAHVPDKVSHGKSSSSEKEKDSLERLYEEFNELISGFSSLQESSSQDIAAARNFDLKRFNKSHRSEELPKCASSFNDLVEFAEKYAVTGVDTNEGIKSNDGRVLDQSDSSKQVTVSKHLDDLDGSLQRPTKTATLPSKTIIKIQYKNPRQQLIDTDSDRDRRKNDANVKHEIYNEDKIFVPKLGKKTKKTTVKINLKRIPAKPITKRDLETLQHSKNMKPVHDRKPVNAKTYYNQDFGKYIKPIDDKEAVKDDRLFNKQTEKCKESFYDQKAEKDTIYGQKFGKDVKPVHERTVKDAKPSYEKSEKDKNHNNHQKVRKDSTPDFKSKLEISKQIKKDASTEPCKKFKNKRWKKFLSKRKDLSEISHDVLARTREKKVKDELLLNKSLYERLDKSKNKNE